MAVYLIEDHLRDHFLPLVYTRPVGELRMGIYTCAEKWSMVLGEEITHLTQDYLVTLYKAQSINAHNNVMSIEEFSALRINARYYPTPDLLEAIAQAGNDPFVLMHNDVVVAMRGDGEKGIRIPFTGNALFIERWSDLFAKNRQAILQDFELATNGKQSEGLHSSNTFIGDPKKIFLAKGAKVHASILNTNDGPIYIGEDAEIMEGSMIRGPFVLGDHSQVKMGAKIYGATTIGPHCRAGGEISNSVMTAYSNKGHDGFLGNSVLGEWCNLGADTNTSNLKNNYSKVKVWDYGVNDYRDTGLTFCGLMMGDHSKSGINTMFNTGTVTGVAANVFGGNFPAKHIPSFSWGGAHGFETYDLDRAIDAADRMMERRGQRVTAPYRQMLTKVFEMTAPHRSSATQSQ